ncbi:MAG TPA: FtsX-like permease family protein [Vicinamibacterales bacterium]|nr:FtsX-like permease family protein [Vicinamibacterales bacterium]
MKNERPSLADSIRGDLAEERARRLQTQSRLSVALWHVRTVVAITLYVVARWLIDTARGASRGLAMSGLRAEGRQAVRALARSPWYAATASVVVALSFALATTVFALVDGVLFKPLPYRAPEQLFVVSPGFKALESRSSFYPASVPDARAWTASVPEARFATFSLGGSTTVADQETLRSADVGPDFFDVLGLPPLLGGFTREDFGPATPIEPALLSYKIWQARFGGDPNIVGRTFTDRSGEGIRVAGVLSPPFVFPHPAGQVAPVMLVPIHRRTDGREDKLDERGTLVLARVPPAVSPTFEARLTAATVAIAASFPPLPPAPPGMSEIRKITRGPFDMVRALPLSDVMVEQTQTVSAAIFTIAAALVVLASLNLAGLTAGRALDRRRELSLRRALGGSGLALARLLLVENAIVIGAGALCGVVAARWLLNVVVTLMPPSLLLLKPSTIDWRVVVFAALAAAIALSIVTAWSVRVALRTSTGGSVARAAGTTEQTRSTGRSWLIAAEVAIALVMAVSAALVSASLVRVWQQPTGFRTDNTAALLVALPRDPGIGYITALLDSVEKVPGVSAVGGLSYMFLQNASMGSFFEPPPGIASGDTEHVYATAGIFRALGVTLRAGAWPAPQVFDQRPVIVVSQDVADRFWPGRSAVGQQLVRQGKVFSVVAVVSDTRLQALDRDPMGSIYASVAHLDKPSIINLIVAFDGDAARGLDAVVAAMTANYPEIRIRTARTMVDALGASSSVQRRTFQTWLFSSFGFAGLVIAGVGVLGTMAMATSRRSREMGVRLALGATREGLIRLILREQLVPVIAGLVAGGTVAAWSAQFLKTLLFKMTPYDGPAWLVAIIVLLSVAVIASLIPAWRAGRVDPVIVLRAE